MKPWETSKWIIYKQYAKYLSEYDEYCGTLDIECPTFETFLIMKLEGVV